MLKTFKFRLYPNKNQEVLLDKHIGSSRFLYNFFLNYSNNCYKNTKTATNYYAWSKELSLLKKTEKYSWLNEINSQVLQSSLKNLDNSYKRFFKKLSGFPKFKNKHKSKWSFSIPQNVKLELSETNDKFDVEIIEQECGIDHIHILFRTKPTLEMTKFINAIKGHSSRELRKKYKEFLSDKLWGDSFWSPSYFLATTGNVTIDILKQYVENQRSGSDGKE